MERQNFRQRLNAFNFVQDWEVEVKPRGGEPIPVLIAVTSIKNSQHETVGLRWLLRDIQLRKAMERQLQAARNELEQRIVDRTAELSQREAFLSSIYDGAEQSIFVVAVTATNDFRYVSFNRSAQQSTGLSLQEIENKTPEDVFGLETGARFRQNYERCVQADRSIVYEDHFIFDDRPVWTLTTLSPLRNPQGKINQLVGTVLDISDRKQTELRLEQQIQQEALLADVAQEIQRSLQLEDVLSRTVERVKEFLNCDRVIIFRFRPDWQGDVITESVGAEWLSLLSTTISDPCLSERYIEAYRQGHISILSDLDQASLEPCYAEFLQQLQVKASLAVPILQGDSLWGLLIAHSCAAPRPWQADEVALMQRLATKVGIAIQQSELYEQTRQELVEREQMQAVLEENEERFRTLSTAAPIGICQTNADGICLYTNARWQEMSGLSFEDSLGNGWLQAIHPEDYKPFIAAWEDYLRTEGTNFSELRLVAPNGQIRWVFAQVAMMRSTTHEVIGYVSTFEDITERKRAEESLQESRQQLQSILDHAPAVIYVLDPKNRYQLVNRRYADLFSTTLEDLVGKSIYDVWASEIADTFAAQNRALFETNRLFQIEEVVSHPDGQQHTYLTIKFPLYDATGTPYGLCGISTDITDQKQLEAQFYRAQRLESLGTLASGIAHDLNNVLTPILAIAQLLQLRQSNLNERFASRSSERSQEMLKMLEESTKRGANLVQQILTFARGGDGKRNPVQMTHLLQDVMAVVQQTFPKSIELRQDIPTAGIGVIDADPTQLHQVLMNLCVNARDAMPNDGILTLSVQNCYVDELFAQLNFDAQVGAYVLITVADTGTGMPPETLDRIFDPFFTTKPIGQGTGLGLSTVLGIVRSHGGFLQVSSRVGQGTQFRVYLPITSTIATEYPSGEAALQGNGEGILIVEDDPAVQAAVRSVLEAHRYTTLVADDGIDAIALYADHRDDIQVVLMDVMMPNLGGISTIQTLKRINSDVNIIAVSGLSSNREAALAAGAQVFLSKPYALEDLLQVVSDLIHDPTYSNPI